MDNSDQIKRAKEAFQVLDTDDDGLLTYSELKTVLLSLNPNWAEKKLHEVIFEIDKNGDGGISQDEFLKWLSNVESDYDIESEDAILETFSTFDKDGDGYICAEDFFTVMKQMNSHITHEEAIKIIEAADENGDGLISFDEFIDIIRANRATTVK